MNIDYKCVKHDASNLLASHFITKSLSILRRIIHPSKWIIRFTLHMKLSCQQSQFLIQSIWVNIYCKCVWQNLGEGFNLVENPGFDSTSYNFVLDFRYSQFPSRDNRILSGFGNILSEFQAFLRLRRSFVTFQQNQLLESVFNCCGCDICGI